MFVFVIVLGLLGHTQRDVVALGTLGPSQVLSVQVRCYALSVQVNKHVFVKVNQNNTGIETAMLSQSKIGEMLSVQVRCYALSDQIFGHHGDPHKR